jgi:Domain of Unknown Function (DUF1080)
MKSVHGRRALLSLSLLVLCAPWWGDARMAMAATSSGDVRPFLGRWDVTLKTPEREYGSWLEVFRDSGKLEVRMVGRWGHARVLPQAEIIGDRIRFVSPKEEEGRADSDMVFEAQRVGADLVGETTGPDGTVWTWRGIRAPALKASPAIRWGRSISLFNGEDLTGWRMSDPKTGKPWTIKDGVLVSPGGGPDLLTLARFGDFKLHIEFNCEAGANSGVYLRGRYEVQVEDDAEPEGPNMRLGSVYGFLVPVPPVSRQPGIWRAYDITLNGRIVTVVLDGRTIIDHQEIPGITGGALDSHEALPGPIYLQGGEVGHVAYRNIVITPARGR